MIFHNRWIGAAFIIVSLCISSTSNADLQGRLPDANGVYQAVYDTDLNITWLADANLAASNTFGVAGIIPIEPDGQTALMNWDTAQNFINAVNAANYLGFHDWRLPKSDSCGPLAYNCTGSEMGHLFYVELGGAAQNTIVSIHNAQYSLFSNPPTMNYWSGTEYAANSMAWYFRFLDGLQNVYSKWGVNHVLPVRDGDVGGCQDVLKNALSGPTLADRTSLTLQPTSITATFTPNFGYTLAQAAQLCGFRDFDWQQTITNLPVPGPVCAAGSAVPITATPFNDPPPGGYSYQVPPNAVELPVYWNLFTRLPDPLSLEFNERPTTSPTTLFFDDAPADACLSVLGYPSLAYLFNFSIPPQDCGNSPPPITTIRQLCGNRTAPSGSTLAFTTRLVGIRGTLPGADVVDTGIGFAWTSNFNGTAGGIAVINSAQPVDPGSGIGGVTITSINGVTQTPPSVSCDAAPNVLWPPNGKSVLTTISGRISAGTSPIVSGETSFVIFDSQSQPQQRGTATPNADGTFSFVVPLVASRAGNNKDGRQYAIIVTATDEIGNTGSCSALVVVPHDQGQN